jgi:hypothetical protein
MLRFVMACGVYFWPMLLVSWIMVVLTVVVIVQLVRGRATAGLHSAINSILALGGMVATLGFLGQLTGMYKMAGIVAHSRVISPQKIALGFSESIQTTILGLMVLVAAATAWLIFDAIWQRMAQRAA